jgi:hypothetical protein
VKAASLLASMRSLRHPAALALLASTTANTATVTFSIWLLLRGLSRVR